MSVELFGINIDDFNFEQAVNKAKDLIVQNQVSQVITINPEIIERALKEPNYFEILKNAGVKIVHLATNILRCETASLYGVASLQSALLEKNLWQDRE